MKIEFVTNSTAIQNNCKQSPLGRKERFHLEAYNGIKNGNGKARMYETLIMSCEV